MAIDYIIGRRCKVKGELGDYFLALVKQKIRIESFGYLLEANRTSNEQSYNTNVRDQGWEIYNYLENQLKPLTYWQEDCENCPANASNRVGGCWNFLPYPIPSIVEKLLLTTCAVILKGNVRVDDKVFLQEFIKAGQKGDLTSYLRKNNKTELPLGLKESWGLPFSRSTINSDWILDGLFGENLKGEKLEKITYFLEFFQNSSLEGLNKAKLDHKGVRAQYQHFRFQLMPYWDFIRACQIATELNEGIEIYVS